MGVVVTFDYAVWLARYPEFAGRVSQTLAQSYFDEATLYHRNDGSRWGPNTAPQQSMLLNMLTAHIAHLNAPDADGGEAPQLVGRIQSGGEGSVNVSTAYDSTNPEQWFAQSRYGAAYWAATAQFRTFIPARAWARRRFGLFPWTPY